MKKSLAYIGMFLIIVIFGIIVIPTISQRLKEGAVVEDNRSASALPLSYLKINGEPRKVPDFLLRNQDSLLISNDDYVGKVYVVEFFFTRCPTICPIMNKNMKILDDHFGDRADFGIASFTIDPEND
ncbi:MAG: SCO family protein, partial [Flavobacteriales bacterium]